MVWNQDTLRAYLPLKALNASIVVSVRQTILTCYQNMDRILVPWCIMTR